MAQEDRKTPTFQQWVAAVMDTESKGNPRAVSPVGAVGTMQTMPTTLVDPGFGVRPARDDSDAERERVGKDYLAAMMNRYSDPRAALAAYNWGPGRVDQGLKAHGSVEAMLQNAPKETQDYVPKILGKLGLAGLAPSVGAVAMPQSDEAANDVARRKARAGWQGDAMGALDEIDAAEKAAKPQLNAFEKGLIVQGGIDSAGVGDVGAATQGSQLVRDNLTKVSETFTQNAHEVDLSIHDDAITKQARRAEQAGIENQNRIEGYTLNDKWGAAFDSGAGAMLIRALADQEDTKTPEGWNYLDHIDEYETPDLSWDERLELRGASNLNELNEKRERIRVRRISGGILNDLSGPAALGYGLLAGVSDPANAAMGFGVSGAARGLGIGFSAAARSGSAAAVLAQGAGEGVVGSLLTDAAVAAGGEPLTTQDFLINAGAGLLLGGTMNAFGARTARTNRLANELIRDGNGVRDTAVASAIDELGVGTDPAIVRRRADQIMLQDELRWREAALSDVPDSDRLVSRPDPEGTPEELPGGEFENVPEVADDFDPAASPARGDYYRRKDGGQVWSESRELRDGIDKAVETGNASDLFRAVTADTGTPAHLRKLAYKLSTIADDTDLGIVDYSRVKGPASKWLGVYWSDTHTMGIRMARPDIILHEGVHGAVGNIQSTPKHLLPERARVAVQSIEDALENVRAQFAQAREGDINPALKALLDDPQGPISNAKELVSYGMTDKPFQEWLATVPAPAGSKLANAWVWFKDMIAEMLGLTGDERTALDDVIGATGDLIDYVRDNPVEARGIIEAEAERSAARGARVAADPALTRRGRADIDRRYGLKERVSDNSERKIQADMISRAEQIVAKYPIDEVRAHTLLEKGGLEATSTTLLVDSSPMSKAFALTYLENPEGAGGRRATTGSMDRAARFEEYIGTSLRTLEASRQLWLKEQGVGTWAGVVRQNELQLRFNSELSAERLARQQGIPTTPSRAIKEAADALDPSYTRMVHDHKMIGTIGSQRLPEGGAAGYFSRSWLVGKMRSMTGAQNTALLNALSDQFVKTAGFDPEFSKELAVKMVERFKRRAVGAANQETTLYSADTADIVRDSLTAMGLSEEEITKNLNRFGRGGAKYTKGRIQLDMLQSYDDGAGGRMRLMDFIEQDQEKLLRQYASRSAGEISLAKYGIMGEAGAKLYREGMQITGATKKAIDAYDQVISEVLGKQVGTGDPTLLTNIRLLTQMTRLGSAVYNQMGIYGDAVVALSAGRVFEAIGAMPRLRAEIKAKLRGETVENGILDSLETMGADFGTAEYRVIGLGTLDEHAAMSGAEDVGVLSKAIRMGSNATRILSGHRLVMAVQHRGIAEQIVQKAWQYIRDGIDDAALSDMGLDPVLTARLRAVMPSVVEFDGNGKVKVFNANNAPVESNTDMLAFRNAVMRGAHQIMMREFIGETGKWAHNGYLKMLFQFRIVSLASQQKQLGRNLAVHGATKTALIAGAAASVAVPIHLARVASKVALMPEEQREDYLDKQLDPIMVGRQVMNYIGTLGLIPDMMDVGGAVAVGWADNAAGAAGAELPEWLKPTGGRGSMNQGGLVGGQFAPGLGLVNDYGSVLTGNTNKIRAVTPGATLPYVLPFWMGAEAALDDE